MVFMFYKVPRPSLSSNSLVENQHPYVGLLLRFEVILGRLVSFMLIIL
jgi:hypothetical protein